VEQTAVKYLEEQRTEKQRTLIGKLMNCPKCNADVEENATFCNSCGYKLSGDGQILSTNAVASIQEKSTQLFERVTYSTLTKVLFFSTVLAMIGGVVSMFSFVEGAYVYTLPAIIMIIVSFDLTIKSFVDIDITTSETLNQVLRLLLTFFAYSLFLIMFAGVVIGVSMLVGTWKYGGVIAAYTGLIAVYGGVLGFFLLIMYVIYMIASVRANHK